MSYILKCVSHVFKPPLFKDHLKDSFKVVENVFNCSSVAKSDDHSL